MTTVIRTIYHSIVRIKNILVWWCEAKYERRQLQKPETIYTELDGKFLILIPHADDEWIGCSRLIVGDYCVLLLYMNCLGGDSERRHKERYLELKKIADRYACNLTAINSQSTLQECISNFQPDYILVPSYIDWHNEHFDVMLELKRYIENKNGYQEFSILMYQVSIPVLPDMVNHALPLTKSLWKEKWSVFKENYKTQKKFPYRRFAQNERINGALIGSYAAEVYVEMDTSSWCKVLDSKLITEKEKGELKKGLNSISAIRCMVNRFGK